MVSGGCFFVAEIRRKLQENRFFWRRGCGVGIWWVDERKMTDFIGGRWENGRVLRREMQGKW